VILIYLDFGGMLILKHLVTINNSLILDRDRMSWTYPIKSQNLKNLTKYNP